METERLIPSYPVKYRRNHCFKKTRYHWPTVRFRRVLASLGQYGITYPPIRIILCGYLSIGMITVTLIIGVMYESLIDLIASSQGNPSSR